MTVLIDDRYELLGTAPLGHGKFGEVWEAHDHHLGRTVALKLFFPNPMPANIRRAFVYQEAKFLETVRAPNILPILNADADEARDLPYIAMDVAPDGSAEDQLDHSPQGILPRLACSWMRGVLIGLRGCHDARVLHGDIKPANVFLGRHDAALLGDLGVARQMDASGRAAPAGDLLVQPPETFDSGVSDARSDIYGVGVTLYRLLTGRWPYFDDDPVRLAALIAAGRLARVRDVAPHVPRGLALLVERALAVNPADRFNDAQTMHTALVAQGTFVRNWLPLIHAGHSRCWEERDRAAPHSVCVTGTARVQNVEVTHGAAGRIHRLRAQGLNQTQLPVHLRRIFDDLGC